ncbi:MAG: GldG family protein [Candidatus Pacebacteria bacterium]|nr:GldG family protein [Candidatus Paceibacterota bacterium]
MNKNLIKSANGSILIFLSFLLAVNYLVSQQSFYVDLTQEKIYTASDASRDILGNIEEPVNITFYISEDLPSNLLTFKTEMQDIMNQYEDISQGKLNIKYETPDNEDATAQELALKGIPQLQSEVFEKDKIEVKRFFFGAEISSGDEENEKSEVLASISSLSSFEYDLVSAIYSVSKRDKEIIAFLSGHGEKALDTTELEKSYEIQSVAISADEGNRGFYVAQDPAGAEDLQTSEIASEELVTTEEEKEFISPTTLIIAKLEGDLSIDEISVIKEFVSGGGKMIVLAEKINPDLEQGFVAKNIESNINELIKDYGIEIENNLAYDKSNSTISYYKQTYFGRMPAESYYPFWIQAIAENFSNHSSLSKIQSMTFLWASSLKAEGNDAYDVETLITSTKDASLLSGDALDISPEARLSFADSSKRVLAASATAKDGSGGQVVVVGDSDFVSPGFMNPLPDNEIFFLNLVDSVSSAANLSSIRSKNISGRPIRAVTDSEKNYWKFFTIFGGAVLLGAYGFMRISKRKKLSKS